MKEEYLARIMEENIESLSSQGKSFRAFILFSFRQSSMHGTDR